jgi:hypothetical protein
MRNWNFAVNAHDCNAASDFVLSRKCPAEIRWTHRCLAALQSCSRHIRKLYDACRMPVQMRRRGMGAKARMKIS